MKKIYAFLLISLLLFSCSEKPSPGPGPDPKPEPVVEAGASNISYQLLVYSFADSNGDGIGDFKGIESKLDYLAAMGVEALWLSPIHPATSYHGYDVEDYAAVNPEYGTLSDFQSLLNAAHSKGIKIYIDYVLNHTSKNHPWFLDATSSAESQYRDYYMISPDPQADVKAGRFPMMSKSSYNSGEWSRVATGSSQGGKIKFTLGLSSGKPSWIKAEQVSEITNSGTRNTGVWLYYSDGKMEQFYSDGTATLSLSLELQSEWGVLVRTSQDSSWPVGTKYGGKTGSNLLSYGNPVSLYPSTSSFDPADILLPGMTQEYYLSVFGSYMPDVNYGAASSCETSAAFHAMTQAADKWIEMGVDGFRLDAVKHIYHNAGSDENPTFLKKFYDHCNATYKACGHANETCGYANDGSLRTRSAISSDFYMVGEQFSEAKEVAPYYKGIPALFEFAFWWRLSEAINSSTGSGFAATIRDCHDSYKTYRSNPIAATKLTNHDEDRAGSTLGRNPDKMKLAAAVLLTCDGSPYIYQGEELGYWGTKSGGDMYVRTPVMWNADGSSLAGKKLEGSLDKSMLAASISVENQLKDNASILNEYRTLGSLRKKYKALGEGDIVPYAVSSNSAIAAWYRTSLTQKVFVIHNFGANTASVAISENLTNMIGSNGSVRISDQKITLGSYSSAIFLL